MSFNPKLLPGMVPRNLSQIYLIIYKSYSFMIPILPVQQSSTHHTLVSPQAHQHLRISVSDRDKSTHTAPLGIQHDIPYRHAKIRVVAVSTSSSSYQRTNKNNFSNATLNFNFIGLNSYYQLFKSANYIFQLQVNIQELYSTLKDVRSLRVNIDRALIFGYDLREHFMQLILKFGQYLQHSLFIT